MFIVCYMFLSTEVYAAQRNLVALGGFHIYLKGRLPIKLNGYVEHISTVDEAVRRCVGPSSSQIDAHRTPSPHYLVSQNVHHGHLFFLAGLFHQSFSQEVEGHLLMLSVHFASE